MIIKYPILILTILGCNSLVGQHKSFELGKNWKLYNVSGRDVFKYSIDTLKKYSSYTLNDDSINFYLENLTELPADDAPLWMGSPHIASYEILGATRKIDISLYGGFFYDETSKKYFQVTEDKVESWLSYIRQSFMLTHKGKG